MTNKALVLSFCLCVFFVLLGYTINFFKPEELPREYLISLMEKLTLLFGILIIARSSTIKGTPYFRVILLCVPLILIALLFILQHWQGGRTILLVTLAFITATYFFRFIKKERKDWIDVLKLLFVLTYSLSAAFTLQHWRYEYTLALLFRIVFLITVAALIFRMSKTRLE